MLLVSAVATDATNALRTGTQRERGMAVLGKPARTLKTNSASMPSPSLPSTNVLREKICTYDEFRVSGWVVTGADDWYTSNLVGLQYIFTLGLFEVYAFPYVLIDFPRRALRRYELRVWYDYDNRLLTYERVKR